MCLGGGVKGGGRGKETVGDKEKEGNGMCVCVCACIYCVCLEQAWKKNRLHFNKNKKHLDVCL